MVSCECDQAFTAVAIVEGGNWKGLMHNRVNNRGRSNVIKSNSNCNGNKRQQRYTQHSVIHVIRRFFQLHSKRYAYDFYDELDPLAGCWVPIKQGSSRPPSNYP